jgi:hypothetical protein
MVKRHQIAQVSYPDVGMAGIVATLPDYRLAHFLNKELRFNLTRIADLVVASKGGQHIHPFYYYSDPQYEIGFCLAGNKGENGWLVPELKNIDNILFLMQFIDRYPLNEALATIRKLPGVMLVQQIDIRKISGSAELFGMIELHILENTDK